MKKLFFYFLIVLGCFCLETLQAQKIEPTHLAQARQVTDQSKNTRLEDNFLRKRVRYRIDLEDKINKPIAQFTSLNLYNENSKVTNSNKDHFDYRGGVVDALLAGYANGFMIGYLPDSLDKQMKFNEFKSLYKTVSCGGGCPEEEPKLVEVENPADDDCDPPCEPESIKVWVKQKINEDDFYGFTKAVDIIEDRIFDKNKSTVVQKPKYIIIYKRNAADMEVPMVAFRYEDVADTILSKCQWTNRFNDAEHRNLKEIFELRLFNSYLTGLCYDPIKTLDQSEKRRVQMLDFEHNLFEL